MDSSRKSFNAPSSSKHLGRNEAEKEPILFDDPEYPSIAMSRHPERDMVVLNIDRNFGDAPSETNNNKANGSNNNPTIWRNSSYDFWNDPRLVSVVGDDDGGGTETKDKTMFAFRPLENPPVMLIGQFLHKQRASEEVSLDMDLNMVELGTGDAISEHDSCRRPPLAPHSSAQSSKNLKVSFEYAARVPNLCSESLWRRATMSKKKSSDSSDGDTEEDDRLSNGDNVQVVRCTSSRPPTYQCNSSLLLRTKTKSRLMDPPRMTPQKSHNLNRSNVQEVKKSGIVKSGINGKASPATEFDDDYNPFFEEDFPDDFKKGNIGVLTVL